MTYATLKVRLQVGQPNGPVLLAAVRLAEQFSAGMIGGVACQPMQLVYSDSYTAGDAYEQDRKERLPRRRLGCRRCTRAQLKLTRSVGVLVGFGGCTCASATSVAAAAAS